MVLNFNAVSILRCLSLRAVCRMIWDGLGVWATVGLGGFSYFLIGSQWSYWHRKSNAPETDFDPADKRVICRSRLWTKSVLMGFLGSALLNLAFVCAPYIVRGSFVGGLLYL